MPPKRPRAQLDDLFSATRGRAVSRLDASTWPSRQRFPVNLPGSNVRDAVWPDLLSSRAPLIVAGFASVGEILRFIERWHASRRRSDGLRIVLGAEPFETRRRVFGSPRAAFTAEARHYWLEEHGVSLQQSAQVVMAIEAIEEGRVDVRFVHGPTRLHAKVYVGDDAATQGSSNFTSFGLASQIECNARFTQAEEPERFNELRSIGENLWAAGESWNSEFKDLLRQLLRVVEWREALARAAAELLEGDWAAAYLNAAVVDVDLWPSQRAGIAQALWLVQEVGNVLVADATGSGKTRMGAQLVRAIYDQLWSTGRGRRDLNVLICPPGVLKVWEEEAVHCGLPLKTISHGLLSRASSATSENHLRALQRAQLLAVDEAHNFLNIDAQRTRQLRDATADHVVLFTATPISRRTADLLYLVALLGPDNFEDQTLDVLLRLDRVRTAELTADEVDHLRRAIQRFTVRRTKRQLNSLVDRGPDAYRDALTGRICRFPRETPRVYATAETEDDAEIARTIRELAQELVGMAKLPARIEVPAPLRSFVTPEQWLEQRVTAARGLAIHDVLATMRSSRAALVEHLVGTEEAARRFELPETFKPTPSGDVTSAVERLAHRGPPVVVDGETPAWLSDKEEWAAACVAEAERYRAIFAAAADLTDARERGKGELLAELAATHSRLLAFDRYLITLALLNRLTSAAAPDGVDVVVATGSKSSERGKLTRLFSPEGSSRAIGLCSEAMSEGLNLQGASCIVHLDYPTTVRAAEQRNGRVNRMNSPYDSIEVWWPGDGPGFVTNAEERLAVRAQEAERLLGSNLSLPELAARFPAMDALELERAGEDESLEPATWDGIKDALEPVRDLVGGPTSLVPHRTYEAYRHVTERVLARVAPVTADAAWAFFAVRSPDSGAPRWIVVDDSAASPTTDVADVAERLRRLLSPDPESRTLDSQAMAVLDELLAVGAEAERRLLPRRMARALAQMAQVTRSWAQRARDLGAWDVGDRWDEVRHLAVEEERSDASPSLRDVARHWLDLVRPILDAHRPTRRRVPFVVLNDITDTLLADPFDIDEVERRFADLTPVAPFAERVSACILGVPAASGNQDLGARNGGSQARRSTSSLGG